MTPITRKLTRETAESDRGRALVVQFDAGGKVLRIRQKGRRKWYTVPFKSIYILGARIRAEEIRQAKAARRKDRQAAKR